MARHTAWRPETTTTTTSIPPSPKRTITNKIDLCNYNENDEEDKDKMKVDSVGDFSHSSNAVAYEKEFDNNRDNPVSVVG